MMDTIKLTFVDKIFQSVIKIGVMFLKYTLFTDFPTNDVISSFNTNSAGKYVVIRTIFIQSGKVLKKF